MREPTAVIGAIGTFLGSLTKAAVLLHLVDWDAQQLAGISLVIDSGLAVAALLLIRSLVTPTSSPQLPNGTQVNDGDSTVTKTPAAAKR